jgi:predicted N-acetyltransferase YhbS
MQLKPVILGDLEQIRNLRPEGWPDIVPAFQFYIRSAFCQPFKVEKNGKIIGVSALMAFYDTCWIGHMIVDENFRSQGIGYKILGEVLKIVRKKAFKTCLLIASELGRPMYLKAGFRDVTEYVFLQKERPWTGTHEVTHNINTLHEHHISQIYQLDRRVSGEKRERLLADHLNNSRVYSKNGKFGGFYLPELKEGLIIAETEEAGTKLMELKYSQADKAVLPSDNIAGINYLEERGFVKSDIKGTRMILGKDIRWQPAKLYSRIGGNFG